MATITRVRDDEIQAGLTGRAGDVSAELDNLVNAHNTNDARVESNEDDISTIQGSLSSTQGDVTTLEGEMDAAEARLDTNETDIANLQSAALTPQVTKTGSFSLSSSDDGFIVFTSGVSQPTLTLPQPTTGAGFSLSDRWLVVCRSTDGAVVTSNYFGPATVGKEILLLDGDACMLSVIGDPVLGMNRWSAVVLRNDVRRYDWYEMSASESVTVNPNQYLNYIATDGGTITLPEIAAKDEMVGLEIGVHNRAALSSVNVQVASSSTEDIIGRGSSGNSESISARTSVVFRAGPGGDWFITSGGN